MQEQASKTLQTHNIAKPDVALSSSAASFFEDLREVALELIKMRVYPRLSVYGDTDKKVSVLVRPFTKTMFNALFGPSSASGYV